jgi:hypothetical protein
MRHLALCTLLLGLAANVRGEAETFFNANDNRVGAYLAPSIRFNSANEQFGIWGGGRLGFVLNSILGYGVEGYGLLTKAEGDYPSGERFQAGVAGCYVESIFHPESRTHLALSLLVGAGSAVAEDLEDISQEDAYDNSFLVMEPEVSLEYNLSRNIRFSPGLSYRWISGTVTPLDSKWQLSETSLNFRLKFGDFEGKSRNDW